MNISLDDLAIFAAVARTGSFREISKAKGISPSAVSRAVKRVEFELGLTLLERTTRSVFPTPDGALLLERLLPALLQVEAAVAWAVLPQHPSRSLNTVDLANDKKPLMPELERKTWP